MIDLKVFLASSSIKRKESILNEINCYHSFNELEQASAISNVINTFIDDYINHMITKDLEQGNKSFIGNTAHQKVTFEIACANFIPSARNTIDEAFKAIEKTHTIKNIYDFAGTNSLTVPNQVIRSLNAKFGLFWESLATISPYCVNPETEFGLKIKGIDIIAKNKYTNDIEYIQIKTQKNTLTGSQSSRVNTELSIHEKPVFAACFPFQGWTYSPLPSIQRVAGSEFFKRIGIDYGIFTTVAKNLIVTCESIYKEKL
ncbi:hypothetical protein C9J19_08460 [Photobacterium phosphoreum]|uniref:hypothetical protein n=1 Tax=Photobacterium phosphoreum TaxID=659 RepID=UPI000D153164|nr:hypothetical protein [Photobacterium phosphoreum]PSW29331.1 hypothetical protein C9J19_08460 [Photobacterium phosphoreum]